MSNPETDNRIAITGMACRFAGSHGLAAYWQRILEGTPAFSNIPDGEASRFLNVNANQFNRVATLRGGYLRELWHATAAALGSQAAQLPLMNPEQALALDLVAEALRDAGYGEKRSLPRERTALILGYAPYLDRTTINWIQQGVVIDQTLDLVRRCFPHGQTQEFEILRNSLLESLPAVDVRAATGFFHQMLLSRVAQRYDLQGAAQAIDMESISSHIALQNAMDELQQGRADLVVAGGLQGAISPQLLMPFNLLGYLSRQGAVRPFGRDADGTLLGEGGGIMILKRLTDALNDGDRIYALLRSVGLATSVHDKDHEIGLALAATRCHRQAAIKPESLTLIEAHGSGVASQDRLELQALESVYGDDSQRISSMALGSVKALIGHCGFAAGIAGVIKASLALYHRIIPPAQEAAHPHPQLRLEETPFALHRHARPWTHNDHGTPRRAGISSLAIGGFAAYALLEQLQREA